MIRGHQWWWEVVYPNGIVTANEIHIPVGTKLKVLLESADVVHSFWVPRLGRKLDVVPNHQNYLWLQADEPGRFMGACAEFCGNQHAKMRILVVAQEPADFDAWLAAQAEPAQVPKTELAKAGLDYLEQAPCGNCHTVRGAKLRGVVGPDLTHVASRQTLGAGSLKGGAIGLQQWMTNSDDYKPQSHMPNFHLSQQNLDAVVAYLAGLQ